MDPFNQSRFRPSRFMKSGFCLALFWCAGLVCGFVAFSGSSIITSDILRLAAAEKPAIWRFLSVLLLPFLFSALAVYLSKPQFLPMIAFFKAFLLMFVSIYVYSGFGTAGWLIRFLLMFSDLISVSLLYCYWSLYVSGKRLFATRHFVVCCLPVLLLGCFDYYSVMPLLTGLLSFQKG